MDFLTLASRASKMGVLETWLPSPCVSFWAWLLKASSSFLMWLPTLSPQTDNLKCSSIICGVTAGWRRYPLTCRQAPCGDWLDYGLPVWHRVQSNHGPMQTKTRRSTLLGNQRGFLCWYSCWWCPSKEMEGSLLSNRTNHWILELCGHPDDRP